MCEVPPSPPDMNSYIIKYEFLYPVTYEFIHLYEFILSSLGNRQIYLRATFCTSKFNKVSFYSGTPTLLLHQSKALDVGFHLVSWWRLGSNFRAQTINFPIMTLM
jgi:hypothetical protein